MMEWSGGTVWTPVALEAGETDLLLLQNLTLLDMTKPPV
jgi:hypothetical protein